MASNHTSHMHSSLSSWCKSCSAPRPRHQWPTTCRSFGARVGSLTPTGGGTRSCCKRTVITTHLIIVASGAVAPACEASGPVQHHSLHPMARRILRCIICRLGSGFVLIMELSTTRSRTPVYTIAQLPGPGAIPAIASYVPMWISSHIKGPFAVVDPFGVMMSPGSQNGSWT